MNERKLKNIFTFFLLKIVYKNKKYKFVHTKKILIKYVKKKINNQLRQINN